MSPAKDANARREWNLPLSTGSVDEDDAECPTRESRLG